MKRSRLTLILAAVFFATMGVYLYIRLRGFFDEQLQQEMGNPATPGFREFFTADGLIAANTGESASGNHDHAKGLAKALQAAFTQAGVSINAERAPGGRVQPAAGGRPDSRYPRVYGLVRQDELHGTFCIFLVYLPELAKLPESRQDSLAQLAWTRAQELAAARIPGYPTIGVGLRGARLYGPIWIGGKVGKPIHTQRGGRYIFYPYFFGEPALSTPPPTG